MTEAMTTAEADHPPPSVADSEPGARHGALTSRWRGQDVLHPTMDRYLELIGALKDDGYVMCADLCAVDYLERPVRLLPEGVTAERFEVVVNLLAMDPPGRTRVRLQVPETDPVVPSLFLLYPGSEAMEREVFDLFGISFSDHPDLTRILMPEDWEGHPLRKDYPQGLIPVQFKAAPPSR